MSISPDTPRAHRTPQPLPGAGVEKTHRPKAALPPGATAKAPREPASLPKDTGVAKTRRAPASTPEDVHFQVVSKDWNGRVINFRKENVHIDEAITILQGQVFAIRHKPTSDAEKSQLKKEIKAMMSFVKSDPGFFNSIVHADGLGKVNRERLTNLDSALHSINFYPKEVTDALLVLHLNKMPSQGDLLKYGKSCFLDKENKNITLEQYNLIKGAIDTIVTFKNKPGLR
jgi:hypothetical protein